jgi:hypothetical protein
MILGLVATLNITLGLVYTQYGTMTMIDMWRNRAMGFSHFGAAWVAMAFTCGPHHFAHGLHALEGTGADVLDVIVVAVGFPAGVVWFLLRVEAFRGGRGDRFVAGNPKWLLALPTLSGVYITAILAAMLVGGLGAVAVSPSVIANLMLVGLYSAIGYYLARTQLANRKPLGGWSVSGLALTIVFPTCAIMHGVYAYYQVTGAYANDLHMSILDWISVPAAIYFLWVVQSLYRGAFHDWNGAPRSAALSRA